MTRREWLNKVCGGLILVPAVPTVPVWSIWTWLEGLWQKRIAKKVATFKRISIPLVRRIYPQLMADKIVNVQPMNEPTGLVYYLRHRYVKEKVEVDEEIRL